MSDYKLPAIQAGGAVACIGATYGLGKLEAGLFKNTSNFISNVPVKSNDFYKLLAFEMTKLNAISATRSLTAWSAVILGGFALWNAGKALFSK